jgi:hypothetical protein
MYSVKSYLREATEVLKNYRPAKEKEGTIVTMLGFVYRLTSF